MADGYHTDSDRELDPETDETGLPSNTMRGHLPMQYVKEGLSGILDGYNHNVLTLEQLRKTTHILLQFAGYTQLSRQRVNLIIKNYQFVVNHILYALRRPRFNILNNYIKVSYKNYVYERQRGILRQLVIRKGVGFRIILAIPPRHSCFGYNPTQINLAHCVDAFPAYEYTNRIGRDVYEAMDGRFNLILHHWWVFEFTLTQPDYLQIPEMFDILITRKDIGLLCSKPIFSWRSALDNMESYINLIWNKHEQITGSPYTERKRSSQKNARNREKNKRHLQAVGISLV